MKIIRSQSFSELQAKGGGECEKKLFKIMNSRDLTKFNVDCFICIGVIRLLKDYEILETSKRTREVRTKILSAGLFIGVYKKKISTFANFIKSRNVESKALYFDSGEPLFKDTGESITSRFKPFTSDLKFIPIVVNEDFILE